MKNKQSFIKNFSADFPASIVVFLVALPLCLGIALGSGAPLFSGIIGGIAGGIVIGSLSASQVSISGPAAGLTAIVAAAILELGAFETFLAAVVMGGVIQLIFGLLKAGFLSDYIPGSVIKGMLAAIGLILIIKQFPYLVGYEMPGGLILFGALVIGILSIAIQVLWDKVLVKKAKLFRLLPAPLVVVVAGVLINEGFKLYSPQLALSSAYLVSIPVAASVGEFAGFFSFPDLSALGNWKVWKAAFTIALVASLETLLNIEASDELDPYQRVTPKNRELRAQGIGSIVSGLIGGLPLTSVIVRSSANVNAGARSSMSAVMHGVLLIACVAFIPGVLNLIPLSALAGILIYTGYKLARVSLFKEFYRRGWDQFVPFVVTISAILLTDLLVGILIGSLVGLSFTMRSNFRSAVLVVSDDNHYLFRLRKDVSFLNKPIIKNTLEKVPAHSFVLIDAARADYIDRDVVEVIEDFTRHAHLKGIKVEIKSSNLKKHKFNHPLN